MSDAVAELFEHNDAGTAIALGGAGVFSKWVSSGLGLAGPTDLIVPSAVNDELVVGVNGGGLYLVTIDVTFGSNKVNSMNEWAVFLNGVEQLKVSFHRTIGNVNDEGNGGDDGLLQLVSGDVLDLRVNSSVINTTLQLFTVTLIAYALIRDI